MKLALTLTLLLLLAIPATAGALELGVSDDRAPLDQRNAWATSIDASWERLIVSVNQPDVADRIRQVHAAGRQVILTVGGLGTSTRHPSFTRALRYIHTLPRAERYTISNEPDWDGPDPCAYRRGWMRARRSLGRALLWGDFSPHAPLTFTLQAHRCGPLPQPLDMAVHPYQVDDPLAPTARAAWSQGALGNLNRTRRALAKDGIVVRWWLTEFGYQPSWFSDEHAAWLWPRALQQARRIGAKVFIIYTAQGASWDTRPREQAWAAIRAHL
jgi:hypothetical protein